MTSTDTSILFELKDAPYSIKKYLDFSNSLSDETDSIRAIRAKAKIKEQRCKLLGHLVKKAGIVPDSVFKVHFTDGTELVYMVTEFDLVTYRIVCTRYEFWESNNLSIELLTSIIGGRIAKIEAPMLTLTIDDLEKIINPKK